MLIKEEIEKIKDGLRKQLFNTMQANECGLSNNDFKEDIEVLKGAIQYIDDLEQENKKQNKIIDEMAKELHNTNIFKKICDKVPDKNCDKYYKGIEGCNNCIKQHFEKKVEGK